jgi:hypothetical protein
VVPEAKRFAIATKVDDAEVSDHLWDHRAIRVNRTPTNQPGRKGIDDVVKGPVKALEKDHHQVISELLVP